MRFWKFASELLKVCVKVSDKRVDNVLSIVNTIHNCLIRLKNDDENHDDENSEKYQEERDDALTLLH